MKVTGNITKMHTSLVKGEAHYELPVGDELIPMNNIIGNLIKLKYEDEIHCIGCGRKTNKSFNQGFCFPCFKSLAQCDMCIMKPETCHFAEGTCREPEWAEAHCMQDHFVYLANSSGIKVGITRGTQIPTRWIDQGASQALPIFKVKNRLLSGQIEVVIKQHVSDKTSWQRMLKGVPDSVDLIARRDELVAECQKEIKQIEKNAGSDGVHLLDKEKQIEIGFPVTEYPVKVSSFNFDKKPLVEGTLMGIKGQYLIFDTGVINIRKFGGYKVTVSI